MAALAADGAYSTSTAQHSLRRREEESIGLLQRLALGHVLSWASGLLSCPLGAEVVREQFTCLASGEGSSADISEMPGRLLALPGLHPNRTEEARTALLQV